MKHEPHPLNVLGDFYVQNQCCMICDLPLGVAPELFAWDNKENPSHCYVCKQPETPKQIDAMLEAIKFADVQCIRYRGQDAEIIRRIQALGEGEVIDGHD